MASTNDLFTVSSLVTFLRPGTMWAQLLFQGHQSTGSSKAALAALTELGSPHPIMDPLSQPTALASSSEVSGGNGKLWHFPLSCGSGFIRGLRRYSLSLLPYLAPSAFPAVQYLSQPQPQPYAVHGHFQPTQTGDNTQCRDTCSIVFHCTAQTACSVSDPFPPSNRVPPAWRDLVLAKADGACEPANRLL